MPCPVRLWAWWPRWLLTIIINNVYAFQYPTKNRCTILVQPSFAKLVLLPIREAYEWKPKLPHWNFAWNHPCFQFVKRMNGNICCATWVYKCSHLASNSWSVWMETIYAIIIFLRYFSLLPIREAYEWKLPCIMITNATVSCSCFQFVKRMNGNIIAITKTTAIQ